MPTPVLNVTSVPMSNVTLGPLSQRLLLFQPTAAAVFANGRSLISHGPRPY